MRHRISAALLWLATGTYAHAQSPRTFQDFDVDGTGTPFAVVNCSPPGRLPEPLSGGPTDVGRNLRLAFDAPVPNQNTITFDFVDPGPFDQIVAGFDFRMSPGNGKADGIGFALLNVDVPEFATGTPCPQAPKPPAPPTFVAEEPSYARSLGFGFDIHQAAGADFNDNHVSIHYDGVEKAEFDVTPAISLGGSAWIHARILVSPRKRRGINITITLQQRGGEPFTVVENFPIAFVEPYESRVHVAARSGGLSANHDIDNVDVLFMSSTESVLFFDDVSYDAVETDPSIDVTVRRAGSTAEALSVDYQTLDATAAGGSDYDSASGTLSFESGDTETTFTLAPIDDDVDEGDEAFLVALLDPSMGAVVGPSVAGVRLIDDEAARRLGHWSRILSVPTVAVHLHLLPTGRVLFWQEGPARDKIFLWDPASGDVERAAKPPYDIFCAGHSFLTDGRLLVTGGHDKRDGVGLRRATIYDPRRNAWVRKVRRMGGEGGRWYPTNTTLGDGRVLVLSGSYDIAFLKNTLPQKYDARRNKWTNLTTARDLEPLGADLYPRLFLAPDGHVFKVGDPETWFLDVSGTGEWFPGPPGIFRYPRTYGPAVFYDAHVLQMGGGDPPTDHVELIDLSAADPEWVEMDPMMSPRRHHNATLLPDGTTLVTGGTACAGFNCATEAVLEAELWDPLSRTWSTLAPMQIPRLYHSTAVLLPDGRVLSAGGGRPAAEGEIDNHNAELFSPPYLFEGPRPTIDFAPPAASWGNTVVVKTPDAAGITDVTLVRLGSVTHAFDQNQRFLTLGASAGPGELTVTMPSDGHLAPPGHYMLFLLNGSGVPSVASMIRVDPAADLSARCASTVTTIAELREEVETLPMGRTKELLLGRLDRAQSALGAGNNELARNGIKSFIATAVSRSNLPPSRSAHIPLAPANALVCSAANVLSGIPLEGAGMPTTCSSYVAAFLDLRDEVEGLGLTPAASRRPLQLLDRGQKALDAGRPEPARVHLKSFIVTVIGQSHLRETHRRAIGVDDANGLVCSSANVLNGIPLP